MYAQVCTRPDLAFVVGVLGRFQSNPGLHHWTAAKKVLRYLQRTKNFMLCYRKSDELEVVGYTDSDLAGCKDDRRSTSGYIFFLAGGAISWKSGKQTVRSTSTMQAEFIGCFEATKQAVWLRNFIGQMRVVDSISRPLKMFCDNEAAVFFSKNNKRTSASRLMDVKYLVVRDKVKDKEITIEYISSKSNIADPLTKSLPVGVFQNHVANMGILESFDAADQWE
ncbi:putative RNA-directed DNA polymerase [Rosa chinensis]|uniref:Putative RNA-directed DNA polymerase n=1 Tax=Rosa chinensis TaxID=74649 RepID=A0A2P6RA68_ROSCH|nr:putative RNA-directed DNA polymerase [Rosa chinensis]